MTEEARFPGVASKAGHYESFYVKACRPGGGLGVWVRYTVHKRPGAEPKGSIWFTLFDREGEGPRATKLTVEANQLSTPQGGWLRIGDAEIGPGRLSASAVSSVSYADITNSGTDRDAELAWQLSFSGDAEPFEYLPAGWMYRAPLPKTKTVAPCPHARFSGRIELGDEAIEVDGWPGMVGHNWGTEHAERWVWLEGTGFREDPGAWFDAVAARLKVGPWTTPWLPTGMLFLDGESHRLGGLGRARAATIEESAGSCSFVLPGEDVVVRGTVSAPRKDFVAWVYADPDGPEHNTINCSAADLELTIERSGGPSRTLTLPGAAAYELGMRDTDHGIPLQPFPDG